MYKDFVDSEGNDFYILRRGSSLFCEKPLKRKSAVINRILKGAYFEESPLWDNFRDDKEVALVACKHGHHAFANISPRLLKDEEVVLAGMEGKNCFSWVKDTFRNDRDFVLKAVKLNGEILKDLNDEFQVDREIVLEAVKQSRYGMEGARTEFKNDIEIVLTAVKSDGYSLQHISKELRDNKEVVLAAVKQQGEALRYASDRLRDDTEVVMAAVHNKGESLGYASTRLKDDKEVVLAATTKDSSVLIYASDRLRDDRDFALVLIETNAGFFRKLSDRLQDDEELLLKALKLYTGSSSTLIYSASQRIIELLYNKDPVQVLESLVLAKNLIKDLSIKEQVKTRTLKI